MEMLWKGVINMQCVKQHVSSGSEERCDMPPYIQNQLEKREVLCRHHLMEKVVKSAHATKLSVEETVANLNIT